MLLNYKADLMHSVNNNAFYADLHVHSYYSRATSKACNLEGLQAWAQLKGIKVVGTGDCTHPVWLEELQQKLIPAAPGLYKLRNKYAITANANVPAKCRADVFFMLTGEVSTIYKRGDKVRKIHSMVWLPDFSSALKFQKKLAAIGNIVSDGRPILGLDQRVLLALLLESHENAMLVPAHIWTPWFAMLGSKSGFESLEECFGDLSPHVKVVETGLSSDPPMNWRVSSLDNVAFVSNSDIHSPSNLARNANVFYGAPDYFNIVAGLSSRDPTLCGGTIDMFPEAGKYFFDGHRPCGIVMHPKESIKNNNICPKCGKELTLGVLHQVETLADRDSGLKPVNALPFQYIIPLPEIVAEIVGTKSTSKKVITLYHRILSNLGPELDVLLHTEKEAFEAAEMPDLASAIDAMRAGKVIRKGGYDGVYGCIRTLVNKTTDFSNVN